MIWIFAIAFAFVAAIITHQLAKADRRSGSGADGGVHAYGDGDSDSGDGGGDGGGGGGDGGGD